MNKIELNSFNWLVLKINNDSLKKHINLIKGRVVDLGCGTAQYKNDILMVADEYIGVDWGNSYHENFNVDIFANLCEQLPFDAEYANTVVSFQVIEHLPEPNIFLSECFRILKKGGVLLITVPFMWHIHEDPHDYYRYTRYGLEYMLKKRGFININIKEMSGFWQTWILKFNYHSVRYSKGYFKYFWIPIWWLGQSIAPLLDKYDMDPGECAGYTVVARKPE